MKHKKRPREAEKEDAGVAFQYEVASFVLGATPITQSTTYKNAINIIDHQQDPEDSIIDHPESDALPDVLHLTQSTSNKQNDTSGAEQQPQSITHDLLQDYISLGIVEDSSSKPETQDGGVVSTSPPLLSSVPWLDSIKTILTPSLRLHQEIVEFCKYLEPSPIEEAARRQAIARVQQIIQGIWPSATLEVFGSFATGLYLPTSDIDAVILHSGCTDIPAGLKALANALMRQNMAKNMQVISKARVPIIKFEEELSGTNFDISFDVANGPEAASNVRELMNKLPPMRPLVLVLKVFLHQRQLNEVYSGGLGSYALLVMVASFLQTHQSRMNQSPASNNNNDGYNSFRGQSHAYGKNKKKNKNKGQDEAQNRIESNLGLLLLDFLRLYGRSLSNTFVGVSCRRGGMYFNKRSRGFFNEERPYLLAVEDPNDISNDLGKNSYNISRVRMAFDYAYCKLTMPTYDGESLLHRVIRLDPGLFTRKIHGENGEFHGNSDKQVVL